MNYEQKINKRLEEIYHLMGSAREEQRRFILMILYIVGFGGAALAAMAVLEIFIALKVL